MRFLGLLVLTACVSCDQVSKPIATDALAARPAVQVLGKTISLDYVENTGGFLGLGSGLPSWVRLWIHVVIVGAGLALLAMYLLLRRPTVGRQAVGIALVLGGGLSNWFDRVSNDGAVVDFIRLRLGPFRTGIFNFADMAILGGAILLILFGRKAAG